MINYNTDFNNALNTAISQGASYPFIARISKLNGATYDVIDCDVFSCSTNKGSSGSETFTLATVFSPYVDMEISKQTATSGTEINLYKGTKIKLELGIQVNSTTTHYITVGFYYVDVVEMSTYRIKFTMVGCINYEYAGLFTLSSGVNPTIANIISALETQTGTDIIIDSGITLPTEALTQSLVGLTCRDVLTVVCSILGTYATETVVSNGTANAVKLFTYNTSSYVDIDGDRMTSQPTFDDDDATVDGIRVVVTEAYTDEEGVDHPAVEYVSTNTPDVSFTNRYMVSATMFSNLESNLNIGASGDGFTYRPGTVNLILGDPRLEAHDVLRVTADDSNYYIVPCMSVVHTLTGGCTTSIVAPASKEEQSTSSASVGPIQQQLERIFQQFISFEDAVGKRLRVDDLESDTVTAKIVNALNLYAGTGEIGTLLAKTIDTQDLATQTAFINSLTAAEAFLTKLNARYADINLLNVNTAQIQDGIINNLEAGVITSGDIDTDRLEANVISAINLSSSGAVIDDAHIGDLSASHITTGELSADVMTTNVINAINAMNVGTIDASRIVYTNPSDGKKYLVTFDAAGLPVAEKLDAGASLEPLTITADLIQADSITTNKLRVGQYMQFIEAGIRYSPITQPTEETWGDGSTWYKRIENSSGATVAYVVQTGQTYDRHTTYYQKSTAPMIILGSRESLFKLSVSNNGLEFYQSVPNQSVIDGTADPIAYLYNQKLRIAQTVVLNEMQIGDNNWSWKIHTLPLADEDFNPDVAYTQGDLVKVFFSGSDAKVYECIETYDYPDEWEYVSQYFRLYSGNSKTSNLYLKWLG